MTTTTAHSQKIFLNLAVTSLKTSVSFYQTIGFINDPTHSNDTLAMMALPPLDPFNCGIINVMLLTHPEFQSSTPAGHRPILSGKEGNEVFMCLSATSREEVDEWLERAKQAGAQLDVGFKVEGKGAYARSFADLDGHIWEVMWNGNQNPA